MICILCGKQMVWYEGLGRRPGEWVCPDSACSVKKTVDQINEALDIVGVSPGQAEADALNEAIKDGTRHLIFAGLDKMLNDNPTDDGDPALVIRGGVTFLETPPKSICTLKEWMEACQVQINEIMGIPAEMLKDAFAGVSAGFQVKVKDGRVMMIWATHSVGIA